MAEFVEEEMEGPEPMEDETEDDRLTEEELADVLAPAE